MSASDVIALIIAAGYGIGAVRLWQTREAFVVVVPFGFLIFPILGLWSVFYVLVVVLDTVTAVEVFVWLSRIAHVLAIALLHLLSRWGRETLAALKRGLNGGIPE
jgi:hypothetical protein